jgi:hypothetical protein
MVCKVHTHPGGEAGAAGFDHPEVGDVVDNATAVGVEKHDFLAGFKTRCRAWHGKNLSKAPGNRNVGLREVVADSDYGIIMHMKGTTWVCLAGALVIMGGSLFAGPFAPPAEGPVAFRRDRIPLGVDGMARLSEQLGELAAALRGRTPTERRTAAQMLALALALDPANAEARVLLGDYKDDRHSPPEDRRLLETSRARIWQLIAWLETPEAGADAHALAACLKDVITVADPKNPKSEALRQQGEKGAWAGWIPDVSAYEKKDLVKVPKPEVPEAPDETLDPVEVLLDGAEVLTPLWQRSETDRNAAWVLAPAPLRMTAKLAKQGYEVEVTPPFSVMVGESSEPGSLNKLARWLVDFLKQQHGDLPPGIQVRIDSPEFQKSLQSGKRQSVSAAAAVLASSAVTGREPDAIIIGQIDEDGAFKLPTRFWYQLQALDKGKGRRLVLPAEAAEYLPSILAMEKPEFFFEHEVLLAKDFKTLVEMSAKSPKEPLASATANFQEIRNRAGATGVRTYIDNSFVKQRLAAVLQDFPTHVSAKMLLTQASGSRPYWVSRKVLAAELRRALESAAPITERNQVNPLEATNVGRVYELCRQNVDALERYTERKDRDLLEQAQAVTVAMRDLDRVSRSRGDDYTVTTATVEANRKLTTLYKTVMEKLATETGEAPEEGAKPASEEP